MLILKKTSISAGLAVLFLFAPFTSAIAAEIDFSCMSYKVWPKSHLSNRFREYDVVLQNRCPGPVYWSMCIERIDSDSNTVWETLKPSGYVEQEKKARVNLQTKKNDGPKTFRKRYEEFYVNIAYAVDSAATAECFASQCESKKADLRSAIKANENAWEKAEMALTARIEDECPDSSWDTAAHQECAVQLRDSSNEQVEAFAARDAELREDMAAIDPDHCTAWSGELVGE